MKKLETVVTSGLGVVSTRKRITKSRRHRKPEREKQRLRGENAPFPVFFGFSFVLGFRDYPISILKCQDIRVIREIRGLLP
jgi:hypothetical protein